MKIMSSIGVISVPYLWLLVLLYATVIVLVVLHYVNGGGSEWFEIRHSTGTFTFSPKLYPSEELKNFEAQVRALKAGVASGK